MPINDNWKVSIASDHSSENTWTATAKRDDFEFTQKVQANEGEITAFCKTARAMYAQHVKDSARAKELEAHFDEILEQEDQREIAEAKAAAEKAEADRIAAEQAAKDAEAAAKAKAEADAKAAADAALPPPEPVVEAPVEVPAEGPPAEPISDAPTAEAPNAEPV